MNYINVLTIGARRAGKSEFVRALQGKQFRTEYRPTFGVKTTNILVKWGSNVDLFNVWDPGTILHKGNSLNWMSVRSDAIITFIDLTADDPVGDARKIYNFYCGNNLEIRDKLQIFVGSKSDMVDKYTKRHIEKEAKDWWSKDLDGRFFQYREMSNVYNRESSSRLINTISANIES